MRRLPYPELFMDPKKAEDNFHLMSDIAFFKVWAFFAKVQRDRPEEMADLDWAQEARDIIGRVIQDPKDAHKVFMAFDKLMGSYLEMGKQAFMSKLFMIRDTVLKFKEDRTSKILKVNDSFFGALAKVEADLSIVPFPSGKCYFVELQSIYRVEMFESNNDFNGAYVSFDKDTQDGTKFILLALCHKELGLGGSIAIPVTEDCKTIGDAIQKQIETHHSKVAIMNKVDYSKINDFVPLLNALTNCCIYFESLEPDVQHLRPSRDKKERMNEAKRKNLHTDEVPHFYDTMLINWAYGQGRTYSQEKTWVDSFFRWQRCGPQFSQTKLILVKGFERRYTKIDLK